MRSKIAKSIDCVHISVKDTLEAQITELECECLWPYRPALECISGYDKNTWVVLLFSIDSGTGSVKFMLKFLSKNPSQRTKDIILISLCNSTSESFRDLSTFFYPITEEISTISEEGIIVTRRGCKGAVSIRR